MSLAEFFSMGGYAFYVWGSYGVTALALLAEVLVQRRRRRTLLRRMGRIRRGMSTRVGHETQA